MVAVFPCPNPPSPCETNPNPATGFSSEATDSTTYIGLAWDGDAPPLNKPVALVPCEGIADSQVSQADADRLARNAAVICAAGCNGTFSNTAQTATGQCNDGSLYSLTIPAGSWVAENQVLADRLAFTAATAALRGHSVCMGALAPTDICKDAFYLGIISVISTDPLATLRLVSGSLPSGLSAHLETDRVVIQGTPSDYGNSQFTLSVTSSTGVVTSKTYAINVCGIITSAGALAQGKINTAYSVTISAFPVNGVATVWSISAGALPPGLSLSSSTGVISGTPTSTGAYSFTVKATMGGAQCTAAYSIQVISVDWDSMVWSLIQIVPGGGGFASGTFVGGHITVAGKGNSSPDAKVEAFGEFFYTGPVTNCQARVVVTSMGGSPKGFTVKINGAGGLTINLTATPPGTYIFPFTVPVSVNAHITCQGLVAIGDPAGLFIFNSDSVTDSYSVVLSNV